MLLLYRPDINEYKTIHREDEERFLNLAKNMFKTDNKFVIIKDPKIMKEIIDTKFSSTNRTEEYTKGLPSATVINSLCPMNITSRDFSKNKSNLLKWMNDVSIEDFNETRKTGLISLDSGTYIHKVLEMALLDDCRNYDKIRNLKYYISQANKSHECYSKIEDFDSKKDELALKAIKCLEKFFTDEFLKVDLVFSELFLKTDLIQGSIDLVNYKYGELHISDFKTSKKSYSPSKYDDFCRQLYIYSYMMLENGFITQKMFDNLKYEVFFFNWNTGHNKIITIPHKDVMSKKRMCHYILDWIWAVKNETLREFYKEDLDSELPQTDVF